MKESKMMQEGHRNNYPGAINEEAVHFIIRMLTKLDADLRRKCCKQPQHFVSLTKYMILQHIILNPGCKLSEVADAVGLANASASSMVYTLHKSGLCRQEVNSSDRRSIRIYITAKGKNRFEATKRFSAERFVQLIQDLSASQSDEIRILLDHLFFDTANADNRLP